MMKEVVHSISFGRKVKEIEYLEKAMVFDD